MGLVGLQGRIFEGRVGGVSQESVEVGRNLYGKWNCYTSKLGG